MEQKLVQRFRCDNFSVCGQEVTKRKHLKRLNDGEFCEKCVRQRRKAHREYLKREVLHIRKRSDLLKEWTEKRRLREEELKNLPTKPKVNGAKVKQVSRQLHFYITKDEREFLWRKYVQMGINPINANERIKRDVKFLQDLVTKLREQNKAEVDINKTFKEEFAKLLNG